MGIASLLECLLLVSRAERQQGSVSARQRRPNEVRRNPRTKGSAAEWIINDGKLVLKL